MTREEAIKELKEDIELYIPLHGTIDDVDRDLPDGRLITALEMGIKALEQEPCEDAISRRAVEKITWEEPSYSDALNVLTEVRDKVRALPPVNPQPYEDAISREDALMCLTGEWTEITDEIIHRFIKRIKALPLVNPQSEWLPVSERLPKENETVIASTDYCVYPEARYTEKCGWEGAYESGADYWVKIKDVIAWMPLPKPYVPEINIGKMSEIPTGSDPQESEKVN